MKLKQQIPTVLLGFVIISSLSISSCKKNKGGTPDPVDTTTVNPQVDPALASTIGFFIDDWEPRNFTIPTSATAASVPGAAGVTVTIDRSSVISKIPRSFAGNNSNIWMTQMVTEAPLLDHLTTLHPHLIRFPGGSMSDIFCWNAQPIVAPGAAAAQLIRAIGRSATAG